jgi:hypothetical protein
MDVYLHSPIRLHALYLINQAQGQLYFHYEIICLEKKISRDDTESNRITYFF